VIFQLLGAAYDPEVPFSIKDLIDLNVMAQMEPIQQISTTASKEYSLEKTIDKMYSDWDGVEFKCVAYKDTGTFILGGTDDIQLLLDDQIVKIQSMRASPFIKPFAERASVWEDTLKTLEDMLDNWSTCQSTWQYLEPIFGSEDIMKQMPEEGQKFLAVDQIYRYIAYLYSLLEGGGGILADWLVHPDDLLVYLADLLVYLARKRYSC
jgi:dynein heavy chain